MNGQARCGIAKARGQTVAEPILEARSVTVDFAHRGRKAGHLRAVDHVSFSVAAGERLGIVGESGSGKSTLCKSIAGVYKPSSGEVLFKGATLPPKRSPELRRSIQIVFQDPYTSLNPRLRIGKVLEEAVRAGGREGGEPGQQVRELLATVGLPAVAASVRPSKLSGGQRQRVAIARALAVEPTVILADEVTSALDVSVQAVIVNLLGRLAEEHDLTLVFVTHNLQVVRALCNRICVMHAGRIVESAPTATIFTAAKHPYTLALLAAAPRLRTQETDAEASAKPAAPPVATEGCAYRLRCPLARAKCEQEVPPLVPTGGEDAVQEVACHAVAEGWEGAADSPASSTRGES
jgi:oligopeptide/dipeptide ABC transporter ATP-binding protein